MNKATKPSKQKSARELLAVNLRMLRAERGLTKEELANLACIDRGYVGQIESMKRDVSVKIIDKLVCALEVTVARLFEDPENHKKQVTRNAGT